MLNAEFSLLVQSAASQTVFQNFVESMQMSNYRKESRVGPLGLVLAILAAGPVVAAYKDQRTGFPKSRPEGGSFSRPTDGEVLDISPPGFSWWRAAPRGKAQYRLKVIDRSGAVVYQSPLVDDPVHVPDRVLPAGRYDWTVEALDAGGKLLDVRPPRSFTITSGAIVQPWVPAKQLLARVSAEHPRLLFPRAQLNEVRATLATTRREAYESLQRQADAALRLDVPPEPDYDKLPDRAQQRLAYTATFSRMRRYHDGGMVNLALMYLLSGQRQHGEKAKALLLGAAEWDPEGISSVMSPYGDEVGLGPAKSAAEAYDWIYDLLSPSERAKVKNMLIARADQMLRRLEKRDYLAAAEESHAGRLPGYLVQHAIALAEEPRAEVWMDYALRAMLTVFPHWAGPDGGWAEGLSYGMAYNTIFITPFESLRAATGFDLWQRPFHRKLRTFFFYNVSPQGEIFGFGDSFDSSVPGRAASLRGLLQFHAERYGDPAMRWWIDLLRDEAGSRPSLPALPGLLVPNTIESQPPKDLPQDAAFLGVGWAALHSDLASPDEDLLVAFKSSPYGGVSHSYCDQNGFAILKGGKALALPGGSRYPQHGTPFHTRYTQQTMAQNAILVNGKGQLRAGNEHGGRIVAFQTKRSFGYVCGDAADAYGDLLKRCHRHVLLVRPSLVVIVDDLEAPAPAEFQWLMHAWEQLDLDQSKQSFVSQRGDAAMKVQLITSAGFSFDQTDAWPLAPKTGFPTAAQREPAKRWHFTASTREPAARRRIAAIMTIGDKNDRPEYTVRGLPDGQLEVTSAAGGTPARVTIDLSVDHVGDRPILVVQCKPAGCEPETLSVK